MEHELTSASTTSTTTSTTGLEEELEKALRGQHAREKFGEFTAAAKHVLTETHDIVSDLAHGVRAEIDHRTESATADLRRLRDVVSVHAVLAKAQEALAATQDHAEAAGFEPSANTVLSIDDYARITGHMIEVLQRKVRVLRAIDKRLPAVLELDVVEHAFNGVGLRTHSTIIADCLKSAKRHLAEARVMHETMRSGQPEVDAADVGKAVFKLQLEIERVTKDYEHADTKLQHTIEKLVLETVVMAPGATEHREHQRHLEVASDVISQLIGAVDEVGALLGHVPEAEVKAAAVGVHLGVSGFRALHLVVTKLLGYHAVHADVRAYLAKKSVADALTELDNDPFLVASVLAERKVEELDFVIELFVRSLTRELEDFPGGTIASSLVEAVAQTAEETLRSYEAERIAIAQESDVGPEPGKLTELIAVLAAMQHETKAAALRSVKKRLRENAASVLSPMRTLIGTATDALAGAIGTLIVKIIAKHIEPAQPLTGQHLRKLMGIVDDAIKAELAAMSSPPAATEVPVDPS